MQTEGSRRTGMTDPDRGKQIVTGISRYGAARKQYSRGINYSRDIDIKPGIFIHDRAVTDARHRNGSGIEAKRGAAYDRQVAAITEHSGADRQPLASHAVSV